MKLSSIILGAAIASMPLLADSSAVQSLQDDIKRAQKASVTKIFSENLEITDKPKDAQNWGEWVIKTGKLDTKKWRATQIKGTEMWGIEPISSEQCGVVMWICQHSKKITFNAEKLSDKGLCGELRESYKTPKGDYKKVVVPFTF